MSKGSWKRPSSVSEQEREVRYVIALGTRVACPEVSKYKGERFPQCKPMCTECARRWLNRQIEND